MNGRVVSAGDGTTTRSAQAVESSQMVGSATENEDLRAKVHKLEETIAAMKAKKCGFCGQEGHDKPNCAAFKAQQQAQARATANAMPGRSGQPSTQRSNQKPLEKVCALPGCGKKFKTDKTQFTACCRDHQALLKEQREMIERADTVTVPTTTSIAAQFYRGGTTGMQGVMPTMWGPVQSNTAMTMAHSGMGGLGLGPGGIGQQLYHGIPQAGPQMTSPDIHSGMSEVSLRHNGAVPVQYPLVYVAAQGPVGTPQSVSCVPPS